jgi:hypothetical protein
MPERAGLEWALLATPKEPPAAPSKLDFDDHEMKILAK